MKDKKIWDTTELAIYSKKIAEINLSELKSSTLRDIHMFNIFKINNSTDLEISYSISEFLNKMKLPSNISRIQMRQTFHDFWNVLKTIDFKEITETTTRFVSIFEEMFIDDDKNQIIIKLTKSIEPYLKEIANSFCIINLSEYSKLKSIYSKKIYEFIVKYRSMINTQIEVEMNNKNVWSQTLELKEFKKLFGVPRDKENKYIKQDILEKSKKELIQVCEFFDYEILKNDQKNKKLITHIKFTFKLSDLPTATYNEMKDKSPEFKDKIDNIKNKKNDAIDEDNYFIF